MASAAVDDWAWAMRTRASRYTPVLGGLEEKKVVQVALGQNHSMAITEGGELWTWGSNAHSQLGYSLPVPAKKDEEPTSPTPRQVFGPLKKEVVLGIAASSITPLLIPGRPCTAGGGMWGSLLSWTRTPDPSRSSRVLGKLPLRCSHRPS